MNISKLILSCLLWCCLVSCSQKATLKAEEATSKNDKHNILLILVDDLGWTDVSYNGSKFYETPNIDELSKSSFIFTDAYASGSVCSPSRAALLTGKHPVNIGITDWLQGQNPKDREYLGAVDLEQLPLEEITIAEVLKANDYKTFFSGKWHVGGEGYHPEDQGFDINIGGHDKGSPPGGYYSPYKNPKLVDGPDGEYLTDRLTTESIDFVDQVAEDPFFMMLSFYTVHTPIQANKRHLAKFKDKLKTMKDSILLSRKEGNGTTTLNQVDPAYASMVYAMDENVGRLISKLKSEGLYDNTTIIFTSDNGGLSTLEKRFNRSGPTSVMPLRGGKGWLYEGGIRVPLLIKPAGYGDGTMIVDEPVIGHDIFPTICGLTGVSSPDTIKVDGMDLGPILRGEGELDREQLFWHYPHYHGSAWTPGAALRVGDWKLIEFYADGKVELFNLEDDLAESIDLSKEHPLMLMDLRIELIKLQSEMKVKWHTKNPDYIK